MADMLSQAEIDALLGPEAGGDASDDTGAEGGSDMSDLLSTEEKDILGQMEFTPIIGEVKQMDARIFRPEKMGLVL